MICRGLDLVKSSWKIGWRKARSMWMNIEETELEQMGICGNHRLDVRSHGLRLHWVGI